MIGEREHSARSGWHVASQPAEQLTIEAQKFVALAFAHRSSGNMPDDASNMLALPISFVPL